MEEKQMSYDSVKNVFKYGRKPTKEEYTKLWIDIVNHMERQKTGYD